MVPKHFGLVAPLIYWPLTATPVVQRGYQGSHCTRGRILTPFPSHPWPPHPWGLTSVQVLTQATHEATRQVPPWVILWEIGQGEAGTWPSFLIPVWHRTMNSSSTAFIALCSLPFPMLPLAQLPGVPWSCGTQFGNPWVIANNTVFWFMNRQGPSQLDLHLIIIFIYHIW